MDEPTPAPWTIGETSEIDDSADQETYVMANGAPEGMRLPVICWGPNSKANARLVCAAHDLLEACETMIHAQKVGSGHGVGLAWKVCEDAVRKAKGE